jgi:hypothetical protein
LTAAVLFALYAAAAGMLAPAMLRGPWAARSPGLAMTWWLVLPVSWLAAIVLAILAATAALPLSWSGSPRGGGRVLLAGQAVPGRRAVAVAGLWWPPRWCCGRLAAQPASSAAAGATGASTPPWWPPPGAQAMSRAS